MRANATDKKSDSGREIRGAALGKSGARLMESKHACASRNFAAPEAGPLSFSDRQSLAGRQNPMTDEQESRFAALQGAWLAMREKRRRPELATELDAARTEFLKLHRTETDTVVLEAFRQWQVRGY